MKNETFPVTFGGLYIPVKDLFEISLLRSVHLFDITFSFHKQILKN